MAGGHPLLRGESRQSKGSSSGFRHGFGGFFCFPFHMRSLAAICDTFVPCVSPPPDEHDPETERFFRLCASRHGIPAKAAELLATKVKPAELFVATVVLWLLSTKIGTWILCGRASLKSDFPYLQAFEEINLPRRERILRSWALGERSFILKGLFKLFRVVCVFSLYTQVDENGQNPTWKAIGYTPPEPPKEQEETPAKRPLDKGIVDLGSEQDLERRLRGTGLIIKEDQSQNSWRIECDAVIVGSGCGGAIAAAVLAKEGFRVVVLEKGQYFARNDLTLLEGPSMEHRYELGGVLATNDGKIFLQAGSTVGGGTAINWSACIRTPEHVLREWSQEYGLPLFESQQYQDAMDAVCKRLSVQGCCERHSFQNEVLLQGCARLGLPTETVPRNSSSGHYCGSCCFGCRSGDKQGADETWLVDAVNAGALILTGCKAQRILLQKKKAAGVVASYGNDGRNGQAVVVSARATVVSCGALMTPPLLRRSGLRNPNIGRNLRLHPAALAWGYFPQDDATAPRGNSFEGGIITAVCKNPAPAAGDAQAPGYGTILETPALMPGCFAAMMPWRSGADLKRRMRRYGRTAHVFALVRDRGGGTVRAEHDVDFRMDGSDRRRLREGLRTAVRVLVAAGAAEVGTHHSDGRSVTVHRRGAGAGAGEEKDNEEDVEAFVKECVEGEAVLGNLCSAHQMGSCRMGADERSGAVDGSGQSWEAQGLFVCDGSVFPTALGVNPMITVQALALCISANVVHFLRTR